MDRNSHTRVESASMPIVRDSVPDSLRRVPFRPFRVAFRPIRLAYRAWVDDSSRRAVETVSALEVGL